MPDLFSPYDPSDPQPAMEKARPAAEAEKTPAKTPASTAREELPLHREAAFVPNLRRSHLTRRHLLISLASSIVVGAFVLYAARTYTEQQLGAQSRPQPVVTPPVAAPIADDRAAEQIAALQKQVDVMRREQLLLQQNTRESLEGISASLKSARPAALAPQAAATSTGQPGVPRIADMKPDISPTQEEFILLKERNRLAQYADEAIATGERKPLEVLVEYMRDPDAKHLHEAAKAEYLRAVRSVQFIQREDPGYRLPVAGLFKDPNIRDEADVKPDALLKLLADHQQPWEVRLRVCFLLLGSELPETNARLIQAIKEDPSLDVAKHAQFSLEQRIKRRFRIFDIPAIEAWAGSQKK